MGTCTSKKEEGNFIEHVQHRAVDIGAGWLADPKMFGKHWDKELEFEVHITNIVLDKLTQQSLGFFEFQIATEGQLEAELKSNSSKLNVQINETFFRTQVSSQPSNSFTFPNEKVFEHKIKLCDLTKQHLIVKLYKSKEFISKKDDKMQPQLWQAVREGDLGKYDLVSLYCIDLLTLAVGPVKHHIELKSRGGILNQQKYQGRFLADIFFNQTQKMEVQLNSAKIQLDNVNPLKAFKAGFVVYTHKDVVNSSLTEPKKIKVKYSDDRSQKTNQICWHYDEIKDQTNQTIEQKKHHLTEFQDEGQKTYQNQVNQNLAKKMTKEAPYSIFTMQMGKSLVSIQLKVWEEKNFQTQEELQALQKLNQLKFTELGYQSVATEGEVKKFDDKEIIQNEVNENEPIQSHVVGLESVAIIVSEKFPDNENCQDQDSQENLQTAQNQSLTSLNMMRNKSAKNKNSENLTQKKTLNILQTDKFVKKENLEVEDALDFYSDTKILQKIITKKFTEKQAQTGKGDHFIDQDLIGDCHINSSTLLHDSVYFIEKKDSIILSYNHKQDNYAQNHDKQILEAVKMLQKVMQFAHNSEFSEKLWCNGQKIGQVTGKLRFFNIPFLSQMKVGLLKLRNNGISLSQKQQLMDIAKLSKQGSSKDCKHFQILNLKIKLIAHDSANKMLDYFELQDLIKQIIDWLQLGNQRTVKSYVYPDPRELMTAQVQLIELGEHILDFCDYVSEILREQYYEMLCKILLRGEIDLQFFEISNIGTNKKSQTELKEEQIKIITKYQFFLINVLKKAIKNLQEKNIHVFQREFQELSIIVAFFRLPQFQNFLLKNSSQSEHLQNYKDHFQKVDEYSESLHDERLSQVINLNEYNNIIAKAFDWEGLYKHIKQEDSQKAVQKIENILTNPETRWKRRLTSEKLNFWLLMRAWVVYVRRTLVDINDIKWEKIPGFKEFTRLVILEIQTQEVQSYKDSLIQALAAFMANPRMLSPVLQIVYLKTSSYNYYAVFKTMDMTAQWFIKIISDKHLIPPEFPFEFFNKAIGILIDLEHSNSTAKVCWLLYQILHIMPQIERENFLLKLLEPHKFYSLFFHWSWNVRMCFYYFYYFQLNRLLIEEENNKQKVTESIYKNMNSLAFEVGTVHAHGQEVREINRRKIHLYTEIANNPNLPDEENKRQKNITDNMPLISIMTEQSEVCQPNSNQVKRETRLKHRALNQKLGEMFVERSTEIVLLDNYVLTIQAWVLNNKDSLIAANKVTPQQIQSLKRQPSTQTKISDFSLSRFVNCADLDELLNPFGQKETKNTRKNKPLLSENQRIRWNSIMEMIPEDRQVYIQSGLEQLKEIKKEYQTWSTTTNTADQGKMLDNINANGIPNMPDFPTVEIHIQKDEAEMSTKLTSGWKDDEDD